MSRIYAATVIDWQEYYTEMKMFQDLAGLNAWVRLVTDGLEIETRKPNYISGEGWEIHIKWRNL